MAESAKKTLKCVVSGGLGCGVGWGGSIDCLLHRFLPREVLIMLLCFGLYISV